MFSGSLSTVGAAGILGVARQPYLGGRDGDDCRPRLLLHGGRVPQPERRLPHPQHPTVLVITLSICCLVYSCMAITV